MRACGARGPLRLEIVGPDGDIQVRTLAQPFALVGRAGHNDLVLSHEDVADEHAYVQVIDGRLFAVDLDSPAGMRWDGRPRWSGWIDPGQPVEIGPYQIRVVEGASRHRPGEMYDPLAPGLPVEGALPPVWLEFSGAAAPVRTWQVDRVLTLGGQSRHCKLCIRGPEALGFLFSLVLTPAGLWGVALTPQGRKGLRSGQARLRLLRHRDTLRFGGLKIRVHYDLPAGAFAGMESEPVIVHPTPLPVPSADHAAPDANRRWNLRPQEPREVSAEVWPVARSGPQALEAAQDVLTPLLNQFNQMQDYMLDQFQQVLLNMLHVFSDARREQNEAVRQELEQLRGLSQELQALRTQLAALPAAAPPPDPAHVLAAVPPPAPATSPDAAAGVGPSDQTPWPARSQPDPSTEAPRWDGSLQAPEGSDVHEWLARRIAAIQGERQSRWRRLLHALGMSG